MIYETQYIILGFIIIWTFKVLQNGRGNIFLK